MNADNSHNQNRRDVVPPGGIASDLSRRQGHPQALAAGDAPTLLSSLRARSSHDTLRTSPGGASSGRASSSATADARLHTAASRDLDNYSRVAEAAPGPDQPLGSRSSTPFDFSSFGADWNPLDASFLDLVHLYQPQGELANERQDLFQAFNETAISSPDHRIGSPAVNAPPAPETQPRVSPTVTPQSATNPVLQPLARHHPHRETSELWVASKPSLTTARNTENHPSRPTEQPTESATATVANQISSSVGALRAEQGKRRVRSVPVPGKEMSSDGGALPRPATIPSGSVQRPPGSLPASAPPKKGTKTNCMLPPEKVFPIQIGSELFRLSGASIASDAPSYFSQFFEEQLRHNEDGSGIRTLYIDRDPVTFQEISRHLQGYHVRPKDGAQFVKLFADAQFYSLPRLISQLFESEIFVQIGDRHFQIPRDIFSGPGDSPNFFSLGFAVFFASPKEVFPGLDRRGLLRPPSIVPPSMPNRSAEVFAELLHLLRGYPLHIRNEEHRSELLRDCRYFHLRGLEQKLIAHHISYNPERQKSEIVIRLEDIRQSGVSFVNDLSLPDSPPSAGWVHYARPFVDDTSYELIVEIGGENTILDLSTMRADFHGLAKARVASLFQVVANKMNLPTNAPLGLMMMSGGASAQAASPGHTPLSEDRVKIRIERDADVIVDGEPYVMDFPGQGMTASAAPATLPVQREEISSTSRPRLGLGQPPAKRKRQDTSDELGEWLVRRGQWRLRVQPNPMDAVRGGLELVFVAVKLDVFTGQRARNMTRNFLS